MTGAGELAAMIDHTLLRPEAGAGAYERLCAEAVEHGFFSVCVPPSRVGLAAACLAGRGPRVATVIGFPMGYSTRAQKAYEAAEVVGLGADELDMVINIGLLKDGDLEGVRADIRGVVRAAGGRLVKVIIEASLLSDDEKVAACEQAERAGAGFVKTSTGFAGGGATEADVRLMLEAVGGRLGVKASGGIKTPDHARALARAGASRLGCSASVAIVAGVDGRGGQGY